MGDLNDGKHLYTLDHADTRCRWPETDKPPLRLSPSSSKRRLQTRKVPEHPGRAGGCRVSPLHRVQPCARACPHPSSTSEPVTDSREHRLLNTVAAICDNKSEGRK